MSNGNVTPIHRTPAPPTPESSGSGGGNGGSDRRLAEIESRLTALETAFDRELKHLATKVDIQKIKVWVLGGVLGGMAIATGIAIVLFRVFGG